MWVSLEQNSQRIQREKKTDKKYILLCSSFFRPDGAKYMYESCERWFTFFYQDPSLSSKQGLYFHIFLGTWLDSFLFLDTSVIFL